MRVHAVRRSATQLAAWAVIAPRAAHSLPFVVLTISLVAASLLGAGPARSQPQGAPPHPPGTVCYTARLWCWANPPGPPGSACACPSSTGLVTGLRG